MADDTQNLNINATVNAAGAVAGANAAQQAFAAWQQSAARLQTAMAQTAAATNTATAATTATAAAAHSAASAQAALAGATTQAAAAMNTGAAAAGQATNAAHGLSFATAGATREFIVLGHELLVGNFSRIPGSLLVLTERVGGLHTLVSGLTATTAGWTAGIVAAAAGIGYLIYQLYEEKKAVEEINAAMIATGQTGPGMQFDTIRAGIKDLKDTSGAWTAEAQKVAEAWAHVTGITDQQRQSLERLNVEYARFSHGDAAKVAAETVRHFEGGAAAVAKYAEKIGAVTVAEKDRILNTQGEGEALQTLTDKVIEFGERAYGAYERVDQKAKGWLETLKQAGGMMGMDPFAQSAVEKAFPEAQRPTRPGDTTGINADFKSSLDKMITAAKEQGVQLGIASGFRDSDRQKQLYDKDVAEHGGRASGMVAPPGHSMHERGLAADLSASTGGLEWVRQHAAEFGLTVPMQGGRGPNEPWHVEPIGARNGPIQRQSPEDADRERTVDKLNKTDKERAALQGDITRLSAIQNRTMKEQEALDTAILEKMKLRSPLEQEQAQAMVGVLEKQKLLATSEAERLKIQQQINTVRLTMAGGTDAAQAQRQYADAQAQRAADDAALRAKIEALRASLAATDDLRKRLDIQLQINRLEEQLSHSTDFGGARRGAADAEAQRQFRHQTDAEEMASADEKVRVNRMLEQSDAASLRQLVAQHKISKVEMLVAEMDFVTKVGAADMKMYEDIANASEEGSKREIQAREKVLEAAQRTQTKLEQLGAQIAEENKRTAERAAKPFVEAFDHVGDAIENLPAKLIAGQANLRTIALDLGTSLINDISHGIGGAISQTIAGALGAQAGQGLGSFLGQQAGSLLGLGTSTATNAGTQAASTATLTAAIATGATTTVGGISAAIAGSTAAITAAIAGAAAEESVAANIPKPFGFAGGGIVPSAAGGMVVPPGNGGTPAIVHPNEMVLPQHLSQGVQDMIDQGGPSQTRDVHLHVGNALDGPSFHRWFASNGGRQMIGDMIRNTFRSNTLTPRTV